ncbi:glycosyltransferase family 4 protein [Methylobrevis albus]|uniref:Glycosyltransferase family 4 protein n=1 Tax=Methylobrevis albus TaxID=2793297 RepID=A0A931MXK5_9HYPH|nr:glycosyltransferase family 4 protein [Methylobrevis albus]MBH0239228.1 glycosyltransferase family 4 protein [Methylobrevis albus]
MTTQTRIHCYAANAKSIYIPQIFREITDRYAPVLGKDAWPVKAIKRLRRGEDVLIHIHWEEFILSGCTTPEDAHAAAGRFEAQMRAFRDLGGKTAWTVHNLLPHNMLHIEAFLRIRRFLAGFSDAVLVHNACAVPMLAGQVELDPAKVHVVPCPAFTGWYETKAEAEASIGAAADRTLLCFGAVRRQKGFGRLIDMLPADYLADRGATIRVSGAGPEADLVRSAHAHRGDVAWDLRYVPTEEVPGLIRGSACVVLPYEVFLTSGMALLVMSVGGLLVAADAPQFREILPEESTRFLYRGDDASDLQRVIDEVLALAPAERAAICRANYEAAQRFDPKLIGDKLDACYRGLGARAAA